VSSWREAAHVGKVQILSDEKTLGSLGYGPNVGIRSSCQSLLRDCIRIVSQGSKQPDQHGRQAGRFSSSLTFTRYAGCLEAGDPLLPKPQQRR